MSLKLSSPSKPPSSSTRPPSTLPQITSPLERAVSSPAEEVIVEIVVEARASRVAFEFLPASVFLLAHKCIKSASDVVLRAIDLTCGGKRDDIERLRYSK
ncbi:hypothetical protein R3P38DRAFT_3179682 [Favolaschia claudopus]|uniref:Uncharacterized protein n=1 Tax=Favolaschia claudopus TaxID=2862362 RepID=A0AAW0CPN4_9AGAR